MFTYLPTRNKLKSTNKPAILFSVLNKNKHICYLILLFYVHYIYVLNIIMVRIRKHGFFRH
ncbi:hypothetical protein Xszus_01628 [Xenorhabdus szentirmaii]|nr:hypothetical protein Xsze_02408 [Xenorhabdus szentirmaii DSM 16338]PHM41920.1 hypothetical protein Xszus_01628 [Xenorhabdus szentirmaii]